MITSLEDQICRDEGEVLHAYNDHLGFLTIGVGRLIDKRKGGGITHDEAIYLLKNDLSRVKKEVQRSLPWVAKLDDARQGVLYNMAFQMGLNGLLGFKNTLKFIENGDYEQASKNMLVSKWHSQTPKRCERLAEQIKTGEWQ